MYQFLELNDVLIIQYISRNKSLPKFETCETQIVIRLPAELTPPIDVLDINNLLWMRVIFAHCYI